MELDYSDETVVFSKVKTSQKNKTYEMGTDAGYTLVLKNQYISYGLDDTMFETYLTKISEYYTGFELTPMSFTLAEPDFDLHVGDRIQVYDEEEQVTITSSIVYAVLPIAAMRSGVAATVSYSGLSLINGTDTVVDFSSATALEQTDSTVQVAFTVSGQTPGAVYRLRLMNSDAYLAVSKEM